MFQGVFHDEKMVVVESLKAVLDAIQRVVRNEKLVEVESLKAVLERVVHYEKLVR